MAEMLIQVTKEELQYLIENSVERKLIELFGDPDNGLELRASIKKRLVKQRAAVVRGEVGKDLDDVKKEQKVQLQHTGQMQSEIN